MTTGFCPRCKNVQGLRETKFRATKKGRDGKTQEIETITHHCQGCNSFIRSEEVLITGKGND